MAAETEVVVKAARRWFTAAEKLRVLSEADRCTKPGELGALLRREGLYSSHLATWRTARRRSQRHRLNWTRMNRLLEQWLPAARIVHAWPEERFAVRTRGKSPVR